MKSSQSVRNFLQTLLLYGVLYMAVSTPDVANSFYALSSLKL